MLYLEDRIHPYSPYSAYNFYHISSIDVYRCIVLDPGIFVGVVAQATISPIQDALPPAPPIHPPPPQKKKVVHH